jgi:predicted TIM-barrel fold metal-dependent hydrolase
VIVDAHCHIWRRWPYPVGAADPPAQASIQQLIDEMDAAGVDEAVVICAPLGGNARNAHYAAHAARLHPGRVHVFPDVDSKWSATYHRPGAARRLAAAIERWHPRGVTHYLDRENDGWLRTADALAFFETAAASGIVVSVSAFPTWQRDLRSIAALVPTLTILCDHLGMAWEQDALAEVLASADVPSIGIKVSGLHYFARDGRGSPHAAVRELHRAYGAERLCWGSNFPVCLRDQTYRETLDAVGAMRRFIPPDDMEWMLGRTMATMLGRAS